MEILAHHHSRISAVFLFPYHARVIKVRAPRCIQPTPHKTVNTLSTLVLSPVLIAPIPFCQPAALFVRENCAPLLSVPSTFPIIPWQPISKHVSTRRMGQHRRFGFTGPKLLKSILVLYQSISTILNWENWWIFIDIFSSSFLSFEFKLVLMERERVRLVIILICLVCFGMHFVSTFETNERVEAGRGKVR